MMEINITSVNMNYVNGAVDNVRVNFRGNDDERTITVNGYIPLTPQEFNDNSTIDALRDIVRQKVSERILEVPAQA
ncbi:hypothetical protein Pryu01_02991 [Paraliobacillus ryukyuensis]|uniref:Uncharacterized protein n=1 Tax=Paraliobacillus ryukyuensis TaxID=200904 RepID=A0A366DLM2_9BACI|nr:hypothetical protein [Paraliobacillus ryukyuensis]RBO90987.1 hypothetical protein DES48_1263 [Paraliobacillus ryukyuensis]